MKVILALTHDDELYFTEENTIEALRQRLGDSFIPLVVDTDVDTDPSTIASLIGREAWNLAKLVAFSHKTKMIPLNWVAGYLE